jgi:hypothetical protein
MGWASAHETAGTQWLPRYLAETLTDSYAVVRYIGQRSLKRLPGFEGLAYDYIGPVEGRVQARERILQQASAPALTRETIARLLRDRKDPPMELFE